MRECNARCRLHYNGIAQQQQRSLLSVSVRRRAHPAAATTTTTTPRTFGGQTDMHICNALRVAHTHTQHAMSYAFNNNVAPRSCFSIRDAFYNHTAHTRTWCCLLSVCLCTHLLPCRRAVSRIGLCVCVYAHTARVKQISHSVGTLSLSVSVSCLPPSPNKPPLHASSEYSAREKSIAWKICCAWPSASVPHKCIYSLAPTRHAEHCDSPSVAALKANMCAVCVAVVSSSFRTCLTHTIPDGFCCGKLFAGIARIVCVLCGAHGLEQRKVHKSDGGVETETLLTFHAHTHTHSSTQTRSAGQRTSIV